MQQFDAAHPRGSYRQDNGRDVVRFTAASAAAKLAEQTARDRQVAADLRADRLKKRQQVSTTGAQPPQPMALYIQHPVPGALDAKTDDEGLTDTFAKMRRADWHYHHSELVERQQCLDAINRTAAMAA